MINSKVIIFTDHAALKHLKKKSDSKPRLILWVLLLPEFDLEIKDKAGMANMMANHLSHLSPKATPSEEFPIDDSFPDEQLLAVSHQATLWYADLVNFKVCEVVTTGSISSIKEEVPFQCQVLRMGRASSLQIMWS